MKGGFQTSAMLAACFFVAACGDQREESSARSAESDKQQANALAKYAEEREQLIAENKKLKSEISVLRAEVDSLKMTPAALLTQVNEALEAGRAEDARRAYATLEDRFKESGQTKAAKNALTKFEAMVAAREAQAKALEAQGFYALKPQTASTVGGVTLRVESLQLKGQWTFDEHDDQYHYRDAERGEHFVVLRTTLQSEDKKPRLPDVAVYRIDGRTMVRLAQFTYEFRRWSSYGAFIGLHHDYKNDFAHTQMIPFNAAASIHDSDLKAPFAVVATGELCHQRDSRIGQPEVVYRNYSCTPKAQLKVDDFVAGGYRILAFFNRPKGS